MRQEIYEILCDSCSEVAVAVDTNQTCISQLDGRVSPCKSCTVLGRVSCDYEHQQASVRFFPLSPSSISLVDFGTLVEAYEAGQKKIDELVDTIIRLESDVVKVTK